MIQLESVGPRAESRVNNRINFWIRNTSSCLQLSIRGWIRAVEEELEDLQSSTLASGFTTTENPLGRLSVGHVIYKLKKVDDSLSWPAF